MLNLLRRERNDAGFTLVELLTSMAIFGLASLLIMGLWGTANRVKHQSDESSSFVYESVVLDELLSNIREANDFEIGENGDQLSLYYMERDPIVWETSGQSFSSRGYEIEDVTGTEISAVSGMITVKLTQHDGEELQVRAAPRLLRPSLVDR